MSDQPMQPYLVQRASFKDPPPDDSAITGPDSILRWDYMGAAEFEFGALPKSLRRLDACFADCGLHETTHVSHDGHRLYLYCAGDPARALAALDLLVGPRSGRGPCKAAPLLHERVTGRDWRGKIEPDDVTQLLGFWWDIENDWMVVLGEENAVRFQIAMERRATSSAAK